MFVGRATELEILKASFAEACRGAGSLVLISGEAGVGKTRLSEELARTALASSARVAWGRTWEDEGAPALWPWTQVLRTLGLEAALLADTTADPEAARFRQFDAVARALSAAAIERPLLILLDDLHAADSSTLRLLAFVARGMRSARILIVGTARHAAPDGWASFSREALRLPLSRLAADDVARWVEAAAPHLAGRAEELFAVSEGNPLFVGELLAAAHARPGGPWHPPRRLPAGIREALRAHLALLSVETVRLLEGAAVSGREFDERLLRGAADAGSIDEALEKGVVQDVGKGRFRFSHVLLRDELYGAIDSARRAELHRGAAAVPATDVAVAAHHWLLGARPEDAEIALAAVRAGIHEASARLEFEQAARLAERGLALAVRADEAAELEIAAGEAWILSGNAGAGRAACARAAERAIACGRRDLVARAALATATDLTFNTDHAVVGLLRRALSDLDAGDSALRAQLMARLAVALFPVPAEGIAEHARLRDGALSIARRLGDEGTLFEILRLVLLVTAEVLPPRERFALQAETIALAERRGQLGRVVSLYGLQVACWLELGDPDGAAREALRVRGRLAAFPQPQVRWRGLLIDAMLAGAAGRFADAEALEAEAQALAEEHEVVEAAIQVCVQRQLLLYTRGDADGYTQTDADLERVLGSNPLVAVYRAIHDAMLGRAESVRVSLDLARSLPRESLPGLGVLGWVCIQAGVTEHAGWLYDEVARREHLPLLIGPLGLEMIGPTALLLGRLAALLGRAAEAQEHYARALEVSQRIQARPYVAQTLLARAELGGTAARADAEAALSIARELGMRVVGERAEKLLGPPEPVRHEASALALTRQGALWTLSARGREVMLRDGKGVLYLDTLARSPHREVHVFELVGAEHDSDAGPMLDEPARLAYRERAGALREELEDATRCNDVGRVELARRELDAIAGELARAFGLGGRGRRAGSLVERARINVQRRLRAAIRQVGDADGVLARHLELSLRTGIFCMYAPTWPA